MNAARVTALLAEMEPRGTSRPSPRAVEVWLRAGWVDEDEAAAWREGLDAWRRFDRLEPEPELLN